ncbi:MAG: hypothetical protein ACO30N_00325 [Schleiferiaceae bacterium]
MIRRAIFTAAVALGLASCDNTLDVTADFERVPIVYGVINPKSDTQYVRVGRSYLGQDGPVGGFNHPDSLYYPNLVAELKAYGPNGALIFTENYTETTDIPKDSGLFTGVGHKVYRFIRPGFSRLPNRTELRYELTLREAAGGPVLATSATPCVDSLRLKSPGYFGTFKLAIASKNGYKLEWYQSKNARIYQGYLDVHYVEMQPGNQGDSVRHKVRYPLPYITGGTLAGGVLISNTVDYGTFYNFLKESIPPAPTGTVRFFRGMDLYLTAGSDDLATYISVSQPSNSINQDPPFYTNIQGGAGIFGSRSHIFRPYLGLSNPSLDSLGNSVLTCALQFARATGGDTCACGPQRLWDRCY